MKKEEVLSFISVMRNEFGKEGKSKFEEYESKALKWIERQFSRNEEVDNIKIYEKLANLALEFVDIDSGIFEFIASYPFVQGLYVQASKNRGYNLNEGPYGNYYDLVKQLSYYELPGGYNVYNKQIIENYSEEEIRTAGTFIEPERDYLFKYIGIFMLADRYLATPKRGEIYELPQERFLTIAMILMQKETVDRLAKVKEAYWAMSNLYMTVATPTLSNAGKDGGQLSSCFIDVMEDSIDGIYGTNQDTARVSKAGGGQGVYVGKVRGLGASIQGRHGVSSGTVPWIRLLNQTAVSVDQLGQRQGAIAVYQDVWHMDVFKFLDLKTNNGDERLKAHDIFTGLCIPDLFMEKVEARESWYLFEALYTEQYLGFRLEDHFDEKKGDGSFRRLYAQAVEAAEKGILPEFAYNKVEAIDVMKAIMKSQLETGVPYMFYRDEVNRTNPNKHQGMIYCSNLCTEIMQNLSATSITKEYLDENGDIIIVKKPGDFVVCNLSSINLPRAYADDVLERLIPIQVRMLDNVIGINNIPVLQGKRTNERTRPIGLGTFGWHHLLAQEGIYWEGEESVIFADKIYEKIAYHTILASHELALEKGSYDLYEGSDWNTGEYFKLRDYRKATSANNFDWEGLAKKVSTKGIRNGYLMAVAPNSSTAKIGGSSDGIDPIYGLDFYEEKKNFKFKVLAPGLNPKTYPYYVKNRFELDQIWSIKQNAARQRHVDQGVSFNLYVYSQIKAPELLNIIIEGWKAGLKTTYYLKSTIYDASNECEACHS